jgi:hypothetical protein
MWTAPILTTVEPGAATEASQERTSTIVANDSDVVATDQREDPRKLDGGIASKPHASVRLKKTAKLHPEVKESKPKPPAVTPEPLAAGHRRTKPDAQEAEKPRSKAEMYEEFSVCHFRIPVPMWLWRFGTWDSELKKNTSTTRFIQSVGTANNVRC